MDVLGRAGQQLVGEVVADHRQHGDQHAGQDGLPGQRQRHPQERAHPVQPQVAAGLDERRVDPVQAGVEHQDQVRDVAVDQAEDHGEGVSAEPVDRGGDDADRGQRLVHVAVGLQQVDPGQHAHHVADPERRDQQDEEQDLAPPGEPGHEVGRRVGDQQREQRRHRDVPDRPPHDRPDERRAADQVVPDVDDVGRAPAQRVPHRDRRLEQPVQLAHGDGQHGVERHDEQQDEPDHAGQRQQHVEQLAVLGVVPPRRARLVWRPRRASLVAGRCHRRRPLDPVADHEPGLLPVSTSASTGSCSSLTPRRK